MRARKGLTAEEAEGEEPQMNTDGPEGIETRRATEKKNGLPSLKPQPQASSLLPSPGP